MKLPSSKEFDLGAYFERNLKSGRGTITKSCRNYFFELRSVLGEVIFYNGYTSKKKALQAMRAR